ncbi:MAG TPA: BTAD domain-containing putative transcriptional regulator [Gaiella sp.]
MELKILGPFEVRDASGKEVRLPTGRERALLAVLALHRGEVVSVDVLVDALWGENPPSTSAKAVQGYVSHLRRLLDPAGENGVLRTQPPGYVLRIDDGVVDAARFERLAAEGWRRLEDDPGTALGIFEEALGLWRGPALGEFAFAEFAQTEIHRLDELRLETIEGRFEAMLLLGRHGAVVAELETCVAEHPLRERVRRQLMLALYRSGRQAEALEAYRDGRRLLADELGLDPSIELQRLERAILAQDPALEAARRPGRPPPPAEPPVRRWRGRLVTVIGGSALLAVAVAGVTAGYLLVRDESPAPVAVVPPALVVVDPTSNRIVASIPVGSRPVTVAAGDGAVWVGDARDGTITEVDVHRMAAVRTIGVGAPIVDLAFGLGGVWAATGAFGEVVRVDPGLGAVADRIPLGDPDDPVVPTAAAVGVGDGRVWVGAADGLARVSPSSGRVVETVDLGSSALQVAVGGGAVWATTIASRAKRIEASSGRETTEFYAGSSVYAVALGGGALWVGGATGQVGGVTGQVWKVDPVTGVPILGSRLIGDVAGVAFGLDAVWVTSFSKPELVRLDPATGDVEARIPIGGPALDVVVAGGLVWVPHLRARG